MAMAVDEVDLALNDL